MAHAVIAGRHKQKFGTDIGEVGGSIVAPVSSDGEMPVQRAINTKSTKTHADPKGADIRNRTYSVKFASRVNIDPLHTLTACAGIRVASRPR
jgi:hypothetical protein